MQKKRKQTLVTETTEEREARLLAERERIAALRAKQQKQEKSRKREDRLDKKAERQANLRSAENPQQTALRVSKMALINHRRSHESPDSRNVRLARQKEYDQENVP